MTQVIREGQLEFSFPDDTVTTKYDAWAFYRTHLTNAFGGTKAVDIIHIDTEKTAWLIEVKDYRNHIRTKPSELSDEIALKVRDTLVGLVAARFQSNNADENQIAKKVLQARQLKIVVHIEQPQKPSKLFPRVVDPANLRLRLKSLLKTVSPNPLVCDRHSLPRQICWTVKSGKRSRQIFTD